MGWSLEQQDLVDSRKGLDLYSKMNKGLTGSVMHFKLITFPCTEECIDADRGVGDQLTAAAVAQAREAGWH